MIWLPIAFYWTCALWGLYRGGAALLYLLCASLAFGALAIVPTNLTAGLTLTPSAMTMALIVVQQFLFRRNGISSLVDVILTPGRGAMLFLLWLLGVVVTLFMPRLMAGRISVISMSEGTSVLLSPTLQNLSQLAYLTISVFGVFALFRLLSDPRMHRHVIRALMLGAIITTLTGVADLLAETLSLQALLIPFRTATYALATEQILLDGTRRAVGLMPEPAAFGKILLFYMGVIYFLRPVFTDRSHHIKAGALVALLGLFMVLCTSSAGLVGLALLIGLALLQMIIGGYASHRPVAGPGHFQELVIVYLAMVAGLTVLLFAPGLFEPAMARIDEMVLQKTASVSFAERSAWTKVSFDAGLGSYLIGVGLGATRASNYLVALFGSLGLAGVALYLGFVARVMFYPITSRSAKTQILGRAARLAFVPLFAISLLTGTTPDFGPIMALIFAISLAVTRPLQPVNTSPTHRETHAKTTA